MVRFSIILSILFIVLFNFSSCSKLEGIGGNSSIRGQVIYKVYNSNFTVLLGTVPAKDEDVFVQFGDNKGVDERLRTDYDGNFELRSLYPGNYTLFLYSKDSTHTTPDGIEVVKLEVNLKKGKNLDVGIIYLKDN